MKTLIYFLIFTTAVFQSNLIAQCDFHEDYSSNTGWTQVGSEVEILNGKVHFLNGAKCREFQKRVYKPLGKTLNENDCWEAKFEFTPTSVGRKNNLPYSGHVLFGLAPDGNDMHFNCTDPPCTGHNKGYKDGVMVNFSAQNPPTGDLFFHIIVLDSASEMQSQRIVSLPMGTTHFVKLEKFQRNHLRLSVFSDSAFSTHIQGSPVVLNYTGTVEGLTHLQHGNSIRGELRRELTGTLDELCINWLNIPLPNEVNLPADVAICKGDSLQLNIGMGSDYSYMWNTGSTDSTITVSQFGTYIGTVQKACAISTDTIVISEIPPPALHLPKDTILCEGDSFQMDIGIGAHASYGWNTGSVDSVLTITSAGTYIAFVSDFCTSSDTLVVSGVGLPKTQLMDTIVCYNHPLELSFDAVNASFLWNTGDTTSSIFPRSSGRYSVDVKNICGTTHDEVYVEFMDCECKLQLPNVFTPNNDGENDQFKAVEINSECIIHLSIFNRWGGLVFETTDTDFSWDGGSLSDGVYFWIVKYTDSTEQSYSEKGTVTITR